LDNDGSLLVIDYFNYRIRILTPAPLPLVLVAFNATAEANKTPATLSSSAVQMAVPSQK
jgi:hypothetical protein